ncbi:hypothetical protein [Brevibacillus sp. SAFN-007a]|uniref:hypothetical protein n=1 Tax=Brevibacillus sp. SAFN-007a TaxID=3436862 RepID=UPI003F7D88B4
MLTIKTHLLRTTEELLKKFPNMHLHKIIAAYPNDCYIDMEDESGMTDFQRNIKEDYNEYCITIHYHRSTIVSSEFRGIELWYSYIHLLNKYIREGTAVEDYGIDPIEFVLETPDIHVVRFSIRNSTDKQEMVVADLPKKEFLSKMIEAATRYYETMIRYQPKYAHQYNRVAKHITYIAESINNVHGEGFY